MPLPTPFLTLALQIVPIVVFLVVDALVQDPVWAIGSALGFVVVQAVVTRLRGRPLDRFVLLDLALVGGMGAASLLTRNELFFKLKPAILEGVMVPYLLFLALAPERVLLGYFDRFAVGGGINPVALPRLRQLLGAMGVLVLLHAGLTVLAALLWSKRSWGLISGPGFYAILVPLLAWALIMRLRRRPAPPEATPPVAMPQAPAPQASARVRPRRRARR